MTDRHFGTMGSARAVLAFALAASAIAPAIAQQGETPAPAPSPSRPIDFRLPPPGDDGRAPGVQGPADNGIAPSGPGAPRPTPTPAPTPTPPRVTPTQPATQSATQPAAGAAPAPTRRAAPAETAPATVTAPARDTATETPSSPPAATDAAPGFSPVVSDAPAIADAAPADDIAPAPAAPADGGGTPSWAWLLALVAAGAAGFWYWHRRPALASDAPVERSAPPAEAPRPAPAPPATPAAAPKAPVLPTLFGGEAPQRVSPLVTRPAPERRALVAIALEVQAIRFTPEHVAVAFALNIMNQGSADATGLMVRIALNQGSAMTEPVLARFFDGAGGSVLRDDMILKVGAGEALTTEAMLPRHIVEPLMIGGKPMLVPVMAFDVTYHWDGDADAFGQNAGSFVLGRESGASDSDKLAPLPLDRASYAVDRPGSRSTAVRRSQ
ncbi:hypothetical protein EEB18_008450 [Sphingopyxis sp. OPL5]|uniref:hypothetical protein n=1 Tax=Sphingopyxis sp. OPL5 TaxID=2486273 RepID=UPI0016569435|nr:hypothetical protein [Sphingopyxis sp. OPL5]QNO28950.1 hypothetical protein EEB18_008450 [Sphingopyxis sp. OPL5]